MWSSFSSLFLLLSSSCRLAVSCPLLVQPVGLQTLSSLSSFCSAFLLFSSFCRPGVLLLSSSCHPAVLLCGKIWRLRRQASPYVLFFYSCHTLLGRPPHDLLLPSYCPSSCIHWPGLPCCPFGVVRSFPSLILLSFVVVLMSPFFFLLSCCCRAVYVAFRGRGCGCGHPPQQQQQQFLPTKLFRVYAGITVSQNCTIDTITTFSSQQSVLNTAMATPTSATKIGTSMSKHKSATRDPAVDKYEDVASLEKQANHRTKRGKYMFSCTQCHLLNQRRALMLRVSRIGVLLRRFGRRFSVRVCSCPSLSWKNYEHIALWLCFFIMNHLILLFIVIY